jgi:multiple sugar transport system permease protein
VGRDLTVKTRQGKRLGRRIGRTSLVWTIMRAVLVAGISFIIVYPLLSKVSVSLMSDHDMFDKTVRWIPKAPTLVNYYRAFIGMKYPSAFLNSVILTLVVSTLQLASCTFIGYGFARIEFLGRDFLFALVIFTLVVPPQLIMVPLYLNFRFFRLFGLIEGSGLNLLNTYWPFVLTSLTGTGFRNGLFIFIMRQFFKGMPNELEEAAEVDGAGQLRIFGSIMLPSAFPAALVVFLFSVVWQWNDLFFTSLYLSGGNYLAFSLSSLARNYAELYQAQYGVPMRSIYVSVLNNAGMVLFILPVVMLYALLQRYFVESVERTGLVG